jgi:hypothetical protein
MPTQVMPLVRSNEKTNWEIGTRNVVTETKRTSTKTAEEENMQIDTVTLFKN